jgi:hypothetical protein
MSKITTREAEVSETPITAESPKTTTREGVANAVVREDTFEVLPMTEAIL